jgi:hypothetical protein
MNDKKVLIDTSVWIKYFKDKPGILVSWRWNQLEGVALTRLTQLTPYAESHGLSGRGRRRPQPMASTNERIFRLLYQGEGDIEQEVFECLIRP